MSETKKLIFSGDLNVPNLVVRENLIVKGQSITENSEAVLTKGAVTVINSENNALKATLMGTVIRTGDDKDYAILYDPSQQAVRLGVGAFNDTDNTFQFDDDEGYPIAVRDLSSEDDGYLISWDATNYCLVKSPIKQGTGIGSIQEGSSTEAKGDYSHAEGRYSQALTDYSHAEGYKKNTSDPNVSAGQRGFSIINTDYSDTSNYKVTLDSVQGIQKNYYFVYSTLEEAGSGLTRRMSWRPGAIPVKITAVDATTNTITIAETLKYSTRNKEVTGDLKFKDGKADTDGLSLTQKLLFVLTEWDNRLASKIYFWEHPELGTSSVTKGAHAEGISTFALGDASHTEGATNLSIGDYSHTEGRENIVLVENGHAEGISTLVAPTVNYDGPGHAEGRRTTARIDSAHAEGISSNSARKIYFGSEDTWSSEGYNQLRNATVAEIKQKWLDNNRGFLMANGAAAHAEGYDTLSNGSSSHSEGRKTLAAGQGSHAEGINSDALAEASHAEGNLTTAKGANTHSEGNQTTAVGANAHAEGYSGQKLADIVTDTTSADEVNTKWEEGYPSSYSVNTFGVAFGTNSHVEGRNAFAKGESSHAEGSESKAGGLASHAEGLKTKAEGYASHSEGERTQAIGRHAHAEGYQTVARGENTHAEGQGTTAASNNQHVQGKWNIEDTANKYAHIIGGGTSDTDRKNIHTVDWGGNAEFSGGVVCSGGIKASGNITGEKSITVGTKLRNASNNSSMFGFSKTEVTNEVIQNYLNETGDAAAKAKAMRQDWTAITNPWQRFSFVNGDGANAVGRNNVALGASHAEGADTAALADGAHSEGYNTIAEGVYSHAEGTATDSTGRASHAEGVNTKAKAEGSHAEGIGTIASLAAQHVSGRYNVEDDTKVVIVGWGTSSQRKNIYTLDTVGNAVFAGDVKSSGIEIGRTRLDESTLQTIIGSAISPSSQTFFETVECVGAYTMPTDALPYVKIEKLYSNNINYLSNKNIQLEEYHDVSHYTGADLKLDVEPQEDDSVKIHIYGIVGGVWNSFKYTPYDYKKYWGHYGGSFTTTLDVVEIASWPWADNYTGLGIQLRQRTQIDDLLYADISRESSKSYQITSTQIPYVVFQVHDQYQLPDYSQAYIDVTVKMSCVPTTDYYYSAKIDKLSVSLITDGTSVNNFDDLANSDGYSNYYTSQAQCVTGFMDYDDYFIPETGKFVIDGIVSGELNHSGYPVDDKYIYIQVAPGQTMKAYYADRSSNGTYGLYHDPSLKWTMTIQRKVN